MTSGKRIGGVSDTIYVGLSRHMTTVAMRPFVHRYGDRNHLSICFANVHLFLKDVMFKRPDTVLVHHVLKHPR
jgi:hypothetical protein